MNKAVKINLYEPEPYSNPPKYYIYAKEDGYYTKLYQCEKGDEIKANLAQVNNTQQVTGVIFGESDYFADQPLANCTVDVYQDDTFITQFQTDEQGIYSVNLDEGKYRFEFDYDEPIEDAIVEIEGGYQDISTPFAIQAAKPNIYLYPERETRLDVELNFPNGGQVIKSTPDYGTGWHDIVVEPNGLIDGQYRYLFYESENPDFSQYEYGWVVEYSKLEEFFRQNMKDYGFNEQEIADFIEYWIEEEHLPPNNKYYAIYPQVAANIEEEVELNISPQPDSVLRLIYTFVGRDNPDINLKEPTIPPFEGEGFIVKEWGGVVK
jgi:hypothetical protein